MYIKLRSIVYRVVCKNKTVRYFLYLIRICIYIELHPSTQYIGVNSARLNGHRTSMQAYVMASLVQTCFERVHIYNA